MSSLPYIPKDYESLNITLVTISSSLSLIGCLFIICAYIHYKELREFHLKLIFILTINDLLIALIFLISTNIDRKLFDTLNYFFPYLCNIPDTILHYFFITSFFWNTCIAHTLLQVIRYNNDRVEKYYKIYHCFSWGFPLLILSSLFLLRYLEKSDCKNILEIYPHLLFLIPLLASFIYNVIVCVLLTISLKSNSNSLFNIYSSPVLGAGSDKHSDHYESISTISDLSSNYSSSGSINYKKIKSGGGIKSKRKTPRIIWTSIFFVLAFAFCWLPTLVAVIMMFIENTQQSRNSKVLFMCTVIFVPLQGFLNACIYGLNDGLRKKLKNSYKNFINRQRISSHDYDSPPLTTLPSPSCHCWPFSLFSQKSSPISSSDPYAPLIPDYNDDSDVDSPLHQSQQHNIDNPYYQPTSSSKSIQYYMIN